MITLRMLAIAAAILVGLPISFALADHAIGHVTVPGGEVFDTHGDVMAGVYNVTLMNAPRDYVQASDPRVPEQLVEGHTVFITYDIELVPRNMTEWTSDVAGFVDCSVHENHTGRYWDPGFGTGGIPLPERVNEAHLECQFGGTMVMTPDPFYDSQRSGSSLSVSPAAPTGRTIPFTAPGGVTGEAVEYEYLVHGTDWLGRDVSQTYYAWQVPILPRWMHDDGTTRNWYCPIPQDRLREMGVEQFLVFHERDAPEWLRFAE